jgi:hypothetical protein
VYEWVVRDALDELAEELGSEAGLVSSTRAQAILDGLEEIGLLVPRGRVEALAAQILQERLVALRPSTGWPCDLAGSTASKRARDRDLAGCYGELGIERKCVPGASSSGDRIGDRLRRASLD